MLSSPILFVLAVAFADVKVIIVKIDTIIRTIALLLDSLKRPPNYFVIKIISYRERINKGGNIGYYAEQQRGSLSSITKEQLHAFVERLGGIQSKPLLIFPEIDFFVTESDTITSDTMD